MIAPIGGAMGALDLGQFTGVSGAGLTSAGTSSASGESGFAEAFENAVRAVDDKQVEADHALYGLATGQQADLHSTMIALEEANISLRTMASTRDKVVEAYQQIWNMPI